MTGACPPISGMFPPEFPSLALALPPPISGRIAPEAPSYAYYPPLLTSIDAALLAPLLAVARLSSSSLTSM